MINRFPESAVPQQAKRKAALFWLACRCVFFFGFRDKTCVGSIGQELLPICPNQNFIAPIAVDVSGASAQNAVVAVGSLKKLPLLQPQTLYAVSNKVLTVDHKSFAVTTPVVD